MLLIGLSTLLIAIPLYSLTITPTLFMRITFITLLFSAILSFNGLYVTAIGSGMGLYGGLFHVTSVTLAMEFILFLIGAFILLPWAKEVSSNLSAPYYYGYNHNNNTITSRPADKTNNYQGSSTDQSPIAEYPLIILFTTMGASFLVSSSDLVSMYLSIELQSFAVYILAAIYRNSESATSAGLKYFLLGALSSALILLGSSIIYAYTGLTNFEAIYMVSDVVAMEPTWYNTYAEVLGVVIIGVGFLFKVAAAPFHNWAPDVYDGVPTIVTTWLTVMPKISIFVFLLELQIGSNTLIDITSIAGNITIGLPLGLNVWKNLLLSTSLLSLVIGTVVGLAQTRLKRLLAFSTISHVGFLLLALSVNSEESVTSFLFYLIQYSITNLNAFFVILAFGYVILSYEVKEAVKNRVTYENLKNENTDLSQISQLKGQFQANPILGLSFAVCLFSMAGIPPLLGFFAKYMVLYAAIENGYYFLALVGILASVVSASYYLKIIKVIHFDDHNQSHLTGTHSNLTSTHSYVIAVLTLLIILFILSPSLFLNSSNLLALSLFTA